MNERIGKGVQLSLKSDLDDLHRRNDEDGFGSSGGETSCEVKSTRKEGRKRKSQSQGREERGRERREGDEGIDQRAFVNAERPEKN
jgi:hypothetical protein